MVCAAVCSLRNIREVKKVRRETNDIIIITKINPRKCREM